MAFLGRESTAEQQRADRVRLWAQARSPLAIASLALGLMASLDFLTMVLGAVLGIAAISCGLAGLRDLRRRPHLLGHRLCITGIALGCAGLLMSLALWLWVASHRHVLP